MTTSTGAAIASNGGATASQADGTGSSTSSQGSTSTTTIGPSSSKSQIVALQHALHTRATGRYDSRTKHAVKKFQAAHGLTADGVAGPQTLAALNLQTDSPVPAQNTSGATSTENAELQKIAQCESGGNPTAVSKDGTYRGKYQFDRQTWAREGGTGDPAQATEAAQDSIALQLLRAEGTKPWPNCA